MGEREKTALGADGQVGPPVWVEPVVAPKERLPSNVWAFLYSIAKTFGFPAVMVLALLAGMWKLEEQHGADVTAQLAQARVDRQADQTAFLSALDKNTQALNSQAAAVDKLSDQQSLTNEKLDDIRAELRHR